MPVITTHVTNSARLTRIAKKFAKKCLGIRNSRSITVEHPISASRNVDIVTKHVQKVYLTSIKLICAIRKNALRNVFYVRMFAATNAMTMMTKLRWSLFQNRMCKPTLTNK